MKTTTETKQTHTAGPWRFHLGRGTDPRFHIQTIGGYQIAETPQNHGKAEINEANARLIAAAPALLEACKASLKVFQGWLHDADPHNELGQGDSAERDAAVHMIEIVSAAIRKAEGRQE